MKHVLTRLGYPVVRRRQKKVEAFYNSFQRPSVAPPDWLFPPMWLFLNITSLVALYRVANTPGGERRTRFLVAEAVGLVLFAIFATLYFWLQSPILAAIDTVLYGVLTLVSVSSVVIHSDGVLSRTFRARRTFSRMSAALAVQV